jgi:hypothetical protein
MSSALTIQHQYSPERYREEVASGARRPSGARPLSKLSGKHLTCINYHLAGVKQGIIAQKMNMTPAWVSMVLSDPLSQELIKKRFLEMDGELRALLPQAIQVLREGLAPTMEVLAQDEAGNLVPKTVTTPMETRLSATDKFFKSQGYYTPKDKGAAGITAEDIVREMLAQTRSGESTTVSMTVTKEAP